MRALLLLCPDLLAAVLLWLSLVIQPAHIFFFHISLHGSPIKISALQYVKDGQMSVRRLPNEIPGQSVHLPPPDP